MVSPCGTEEFYHSGSDEAGNRTWRGLQAAASRLVSMLGYEARRILHSSKPGIIQREKSVETSLDAADTSVRAT
jgi:hypothetical protein